MGLKNRKARKWTKKRIAKNVKTSNPVDYKAYLHSTDEAALENLKKIPFFDTLCGKFIEVFNERIWHVENMANNVRVSKEQCPRVYRMVESICVKLGIVMPELYIQLSRYPNAYTYGNKKVFITVTSGLLECFNDDELYAVLAHECGHIACRHVLYKTMARIILGGGEYGLSFLDKSLIAKLITVPLKAAFYHWERCSELSADRAAVICCGDSTPVVKTMMRLAGGIADIDKELDVDLFVAQAADYKELTESKANKFIEYFIHGADSHPLLAMRARKAREWESSKEYQRIV